MEKRFIKLYFSILTACITGVGIAFVGIFLFNISKSSLIPYIEARDISIGKIFADTDNFIDTDLKIDDSTENISLLEEGGDEQTYISRFSRVFIYSADDGRDIIENAKNSLPKSVNSKITAKSYVVVDMDRDVIVLEKAPDKLMPIASITKLVTAVVAQKLMRANDTITVDAISLKTYGNEAKFREGEKFKLKELLYPLLMVSSNDAAEALARRYGRSKFIAEMNTFVNNIGAYRTYFADPSGLSPKNVSTSNDIAIIVKWIVKNNPEIFDITLEKTKTIRVHTWVNPTRLLNLDSYAGGKKGYTTEANRTSVALFKLGKQKRFFTVIFLGSSSRDSDMLDLLEEAVR